MNIFVIWALENLKICDDIQQQKKHFFCRAVHQYKYPFLKIIKNAFAKSKFDQYFLIFSLFNKIMYI